MKLIFNSICLFDVIILLHWVYFCALNILSLLFWGLRKERKFHHASTPYHTTKGLYMVLWEELIMRLHYIDQQIKNELEIYHSNRRVQRGKCCFISSLFCDNFHFVEALWSNLIVIDPDTFIMTASWQRLIGVWNWICCPNTVRELWMISATCAYVVCIEILISENL